MAESSLSAVTVPEPDFERFPAFLVHEGMHSAVGCFIRAAFEELLIRSRLIMAVFCFANRKGIMAVPSFPV